jgi:pyrimidine-nucleoside phosphorylase
MYALRDVTGTVDSIALIASSVMSKKIAAGAQAIVLDVKTGVGAFMQTLADARQLSKLMVSIGRLSGRKVVALLSDMNQPLGHAVGNALEVKEAVETLRNAGPTDFREHCLVVASHLLVVGQKAENLTAARKLAEDALNNGSAWERFRTLVRVQGGDVTYIDNLDKLPKARLIETVAAPKAGYIAGIHAREVGETSVELGAGRAKKGDPIDLAVGIVIHHKVGDYVQMGAPLFTIHASDEPHLEAARARLLAAHQWSDVQTDALPLFYGVVE